MKAILTSRTSRYPVQNYPRWVYWVLLAGIWGGVALAAALLWR